MDEVYNQADLARQKIIDREVKKKGLRGRINAFCCSCIYDPLGSPGTWKQQIGECTSYTCPLYDVRPLPKEAVKEA